MAKRTNILRIIENEITKGNNYVVENGNFVNADMLEKEIKADFVRALNTGSLDISISFEKYKKDKLEGMKNASDLINHINNFFTESTETETFVEPEVEIDAFEAPETKKTKGADKA